MGKSDCPLRVGQRVTVTGTFAGDWPGEYVITAIQWQYNIGDGRGFDISIASDEEIQRHYGDTDGFSVAELIPITAKDSPHAG